MSHQSLHEVGSDQRLRERLAALERLPQASRDALVILLDTLLAIHGFLAMRSANRTTPSQEEVWWCLERALAAQLGRSEVPEVAAMRGKKNAPGESHPGSGIFTSSLHAAGPAP